MHTDRCMEDGKVLNRAAGFMTEKERGECDPLGRRPPAEMASLLHSMIDGLMGQ